MMQYLVSISQLPDHEQPSASSLRSDCLCLPRDCQRCDSEPGAWTPGITFWALAAAAAWSTICFTTCHARHLASMPRYRRSDLGGMLYPARLAVRDDLGGGTRRLRWCRRLPGGRAPRGSGEARAKGLPWPEEVLALATIYECGWQHLRTFGAFQPAVRNPATDCADS